jgi:hypothetical protein
MKTTPMMKALTDLASRLTDARDAVSRLHDADQALRAAHADAESERGRLLGAKRPRAELLKVGEQELAQLAAAWLAERGPAVVSSLAGALEETPTGEFRVVRYSSLADEFGSWLAPLCASAPHVGSELLARVLGAAHVDEGPPLAERPALLAEVARRRASIEDEHAKLVDAAREVGILLEHLSPTALKRGRAAAAHAAWEADVALNREYYERNPAARPPAPTEAAR